MNDDLHNIDDLFKKALEEHTESASPGVWNNIDKSLDKKKVVSIAKKYNKLRWAAAVLLLFSVGMAMYVLHIKIKNRELIHQNSAVKNAGNQRMQTTNSGEDSISIVPKKDAQTKDLAVAQQLKNKGNPVLSNNYNNNIADKIQDAKQQHQNNTKFKLLSRSNNVENTTRQNEKQLLHNKSVIIKKVSSENNTDNLTKINITESIATKNKNQHGDIQQQTNVVSLTEDYSKGIPLIENNKASLQQSIIKPLLQIPEVNKNNIVTLKENSNVPIKKYAGKNNRSTLVSATIFYSPDLVSTNVRDDHPRFREDEGHEIKKDERIKASSTIGVLADVNIGKNWIIESGLTFSTRNTDIEPKTIYARPDDNGDIHYRFNCSAGYSFVTLKSTVQPVSGDSAEALSSKNTLQYIGVPVAIKYNIGKGRFSLIPGVGISVNFLTKGKIATTIATTTGNESAVSNDIQGLKSTYFNGSASLGALYNINKTFAITFTPTARFALSSINEDAPLKTNLNSIGLATGLNVRF